MFKNKIDNSIYVCQQLFHALFVSICVSPMDKVIFDFSLNFELRRQIMYHLSTLLAK